MTTVRLILFAFVSFNLISCTDHNKVRIDEKNTSARIDTTSSPRPVKQLYDYALYYNEFGLPLKAWEHELEIKQHLGNPASVSIHQLGDGADTHRGAFVKQMNYDGLNLVLYAPRTADTGWIMRIVVKNDRYQTARGLKTGQDSSRIKQLYPEALKWPDGRKDQSKTPYYISNESEMLYLRFYVTSGRIDSIELYHDLP